MNSFRVVSLAGIVICMLLIFVNSVFGDVGSTAFKKYVNVRFGYEISYPEAILLPQGEAGGVWRDAACYFSIAYKEEGSALRTS